ncbi:type II toxin-antitoxin system VapB family antitoxin [Aquisalimonas sp.]|uniref:type II toxin-antitoxin system VapB family antitoxin n=1 Tax=Aquisalimonas sp. TaxID=1872621 RepID=UPI0025B97AB3|nr:type II toxin-antitoxin system VapB family antitoxin [Aquisalimonas sp.]
MAKPQLSIRSAKARELAHRLAQRERRTVASIVELALEEYAAKHANASPAEAFYRQLRETCAVDSDLDDLIEANRKPHRGLDL